MTKSFVVFSISTMSLQDTADSWKETAEQADLEELRDPDLFQAYSEELGNAFNIAQEIGQDLEIFGQAVGQQTLISCESYGEGFGAACKPGSEDKDFTLFASVDEWLAKLQANLEEMAGRRVDVNRILTFEGSPPSLYEIAEDGVIENITSEYEVGVEVYVYSAGEDVLAWNAWDEEGEIDEGFLMDPGDEDFRFVPEFDVVLAERLESV